MAAATTAISSAVTSAIGWVGDIMPLFLEPPTVFYVGFGIVAIGLSQGRRLVAMKKR